MTYNQNFHLMFFGAIAMLVVFILIYVFITAKRNVAIMRKSVNKQLPDLSETEQVAFNLHQKTKKHNNKVATVNDEDKVLQQIRSTTNDNEEHFEEMQEYIDSKSLVKKRAKKELPTLESSIKKIDFNFKRED